MNHVHINISDSRWHDRHRVVCSNVCDVSLKYLKTNNYSVSFLLCSNSEILALNSYKKATDVLCFVTEENECEIAISYDMCCELADENTPESFDVYFMQLVVHGILHAHGFDHNNDAERREMSLHEKKILKSMNIEHGLIK